MTPKNKKRGIVLISAAIIVCILSGTLISCGLKKQKQGDNNETQTETDSLSYERLSELADEDTLYLVAKAFLDGDSQTIIDNTWAFGTVQYDIDARTKELKEKYDEFFDSFNISRFRCIETEIESPTSGYLRMWDGKCLKLSITVSDSRTDVMPDGEHELYIGRNGYVSGRDEPDGMVQISEPEKDLRSFELENRIGEYDPALLSTFYVMNSPFYASDFRTDKEKCQNDGIYDAIYFLWKDSTVDRDFNGMPPEMVPQAALELFGIENFEYDPKKSVTPGAGYDDTLFFRASRGRTNPFYEITDYENVDDIYRFNVRSYADISRFVISDEIVVTLKKSDGMYNYALVGVDIIYSSGIHSGGIGT